MSTLTVSKKVSAEAESFIYTQHSPECSHQREATILFSAVMQSRKIIDAQTDFHIIIIITDSFSILACPVADSHSTKKDKQPFAQMDRFLSFEYLLAQQKAAWWHYGSHCLFRTHPG